MTWAISFAWLTAAPRRRLLNRSQTELQSAHLLLLADDCWRRGESTPEDTDYYLVTRCSCSCCNFFEALGSLQMSTGMMTMMKCLYFIAKFFICKQCNLAAIIQLTSDYVMEEGNSNFEATEKNNRVDDGNKSWQHFMHRVRVEVSGME